MKRIPKELVLAADQDLSNPLQVRSVWLEGCWLASACSAAISSATRKRTTLVFKSIGQT